MKCPKCNCEISDTDSLYCPNCGNSLYNTQQSLSAAISGKWFSKEILTSKKFRITVSAIVAFIVICPSAFFGFISPEAKAKKYIDSANKNIALEDYIFAYDDIKSALSLDYSNKEAIALRETIRPKVIMQYMTKAKNAENDGYLDNAYSYIADALELDPNNQDAIAESVRLKALIQAKTEQERIETEQNEQQRKEKEKKEKEERELEKQQKIKEMLAQGFNAETAISIARLSYSDILYKEIYYGPKSVGTYGAYYPLALWEHSFLKDKDEFAFVILVYENGVIEENRTLEESDIKHYVKAGTGNLSEPTSKPNNQNNSVNNSPAKNQTSEPKKEYKMKYESSIGYLTDQSENHYEYFSDSPGVLADVLKDMTAYQLNDFYASYQGQYVYFTGEVIGVSTSGIVSVNCIDEKASKAAGRLWPMMSNIDLHVNVNVENLSQIYEGQTITAMGQIHDECYSCLFGVHTLDLINGFIVEY